MEYSDLIKELRNRMLLTQTEFADMLGVSFGSVNRWENKKYEPTVKVKRKLKELCSKYKIDFDQVVSSKEGNNHGK